MPFFVEDYKWTSANFEGMRDHASDYEAWWGIVQPLAKSAGILVHNKNGNIYDRPTLLNHTLAILYRMDYQTK